MSVGQRFSWVYCSQYPGNILSAYTHALQANVDDAWTCSEIPDLPRLTEVEAGDGPQREQPVYAVDYNDKLYFRQRELSR